MVVKNRLIFNQNRQVMKSITRVIIVLFVIMMHQNIFANYQHSTICNLASTETTYNYTFSVQGIHTYADAKSLYRFVQETFGIRPTFNDNTGKFEIANSTILISEIELTNRFNQIELIVTSFSIYSSVLDSNNPQTR